MQGAVLRSKVKKKRKIMNEKLLLKLLGYYIFVIAPRAPLNNTRA